MPRVTQDFDFKIHEDASVASPSMDEDASHKDEPESAESSFAEDNAEVARNEGQESNIEIVKSVEKDDAEDAELINVDHGGNAEGHAIDDSIVSHEEDEDATPPATQLADDESLSDATSRPESRRESSANDRRTSRRTEALIQAAARAVVAQLGENGKSAEEVEKDCDVDGSILSHTTDDTYGVDGTELSYTHSEASPRASDIYTHSESSGRRSSLHTNSEPEPHRDSLGSQRESLGAHSAVAHTNANVARVSEGHLLPAPGDDTGGDSSSHHEADDDDVFSDRSPRSSLGSISSDPDQKHRSLDNTLTQATRSPRVSEISQYEKEEFVPTIRGTPRMPFRTPSDVRAMQMASPPASVYGSPRSSMRPPLPTISRLGSPSVSAQYSPKRKSTPPRFKSRKEPAPLVLLHATLLPLRWPWASVLEAAEASQLSEPAKTLRDNWRQLQDRIGDTVLERGVLIPHPQNDYEVLEERLLDAMELPLRRRARILECGHYLGPANAVTLSEDMDSDDEDFDESSRDGDKKTHWCTTCQHEIKYDSLGPGKVFRVKTYASNGLMKAGAWDACWKEMERVDVEIEPIVETSLAQELGHLAAEQQKVAEEEERMAAQGLSEHHGSSPEHQHMDTDDMKNQMESSHVEDRHVEEHEEHDHSMTNHHGSRHILSTPSSPHVHMGSPRVDTERWRRDEERLREIYGHTPPPPHSHTRQSPRLSSSRHPNSYDPPPSPPSPSEEAYERRETRRRTYQTASLPELLLEVLKVVMQDRKNVVITFLTFLAMLLAVRGGGPREEPHNHFPGAAMQKDVPTVIAAVENPVETVETINTVESVASSLTTSVAASVEASAPCESSSVETSEAKTEVADKETEIETETLTSREVVRIVETVTETVKVTATATETTTIVEQKESLVVKSDNDDEVEKKVEDKPMERPEERPEEKPEEKPEEIVEERPATEVNRDEL